MAARALERAVRHCEVDRILNMLAPQFFLEDGTTIDPARTVLLAALNGGGRGFLKPAGCIPQTAAAEDRALELVRKGASIGEAFKAFGGAEDGSLPSWATERVLLAFEAAGKGLTHDFCFRFWKSQEGRPSPEAVPASVFALGAMMHAGGEGAHPGMREAAERMFPQAFTDARLTPTPAEEEDEGPRP